MKTIHSTSAKPLTIPRSPKPTQPALTQSPPDIEELHQRLADAAAKRFQANARKGRV